MLKSTLHRYQFWIRLGFAWLLFLAFVTTYWWRLDVSHQGLVVDAEQRAQLRASQAAHALSTQVHAQLMGIDFVLEHLIEHWKGHDEAVFRKLIDLAQGGIFKGSLDVVAVTDASGRVIFSSYRPLGQTLRDVSLADRDYFQQLARGSEQHLFISPPVINKASQRWTVQFSRRLVKDGQFAGVIVASVPAEHLAQAFKQVYPGQDDAVFLVLNDGQYLTRSHLLEKALNTRVAAEREFIQQPEKNSGNYTTVTAIDGVERTYAWHRTLGFPVVLGLGLNKEKILAPVLLAIKFSRTQNLIGVVLLLFTVLWITRLVFIQHKQTRAILQSKERLATLLNGVPSGVLLEDENGVIVALNAKLCGLFKLDQNPGEFIGLQHQQFLHLLKPEQAAWLSLPSELITQRQSHELVDAASGATFRVDWLPIWREKNYLGHVWLIHDISSRKQKEQALLTLATTDPLTGLHNRRSFLDILQQQLELSQVDFPGALLMLDIDHFKKVNDTFGHPVGDLVIKNVTKAIRETLRQDDFSGRVGGEEFAVLLPGVTLAQALQLAERIRQHVAVTPTILQTDTIYVTVSIGVALLYKHDKDSVLIAADQALYQAKRAGRNRVCCAESVAVETI